MSVTKEGTIIGLFIYEKEIAWVIQLRQIDRLKKKIVKTFTKL